MEDLSKSVKDTEKWLDEIKESLSWTEEKIHRNVSNNVPEKGTIAIDWTEFSALLSERLGNDSKRTKILPTKWDHTRAECDWTSEERSLLHEYTIEKAKLAGLPITVIGSEFTAIRMNKKKDQDKAQMDNRRRMTYRAKKTIKTYTESIRDLIRLQNEYTSRDTEISSPIGDIGRDLEQSRQSPKSQYMGRDHHRRSPPSQDIGRDLEKRRRSPSKRKDERRCHDERKKRRRDDDHKDRHHSKKSHREEGGHRSRHKSRKSSRS